MTSPSRLITTSRGPSCPGAGCDAYVMSPFVVSKSAASGLKCDGQLVGGGKGNNEAAASPPVYASVPPPSVPASSVRAGPCIANDASCFELVGTVELADATG